AQRALAFGAHARIGEDLRHRVARGRAFFALVGAGQVADVVDGMVVADELDAISNRLDEVFFFDENGHGSKGRSGISATRRTRGHMGQPRSIGNLCYDRGRKAYLPCHTGLRFSAKAVAPALASAEVKMCAISGRWRSNR